MLTIAQLTGRDDRHLVPCAGPHRLQADAAAAFERLQSDAREAGFELAIASSHRSYERQRIIWNGKACGQRAVHDDAGAPVDLLALPPAARVHAILRFSALPGTSRHHWGTDLDIYDAAAVPADYAVQLTPAEVAPGGPFDALHRWLDERMAVHASQGFFRPYARDCGGVAPERWHLSYAPLSRELAGRVTARALEECWDCDREPLVLRAEVEAELPALLARYVAVADNWCG
ncbi:MAG: M15 family metallopeptidase [Halieaceae bacterium]|uniref:M15 family metallopeptidase n=1 Tax=Haliea alexandrii TaxID=2448162 RepID=UPI000F0B7132|nr:M15 family metallopeptidase [Haliea alexandrii]MCR9185973.1 M15 family metallopeptidase [Halieaceae bacterium]